MNKLQTYLRINALFSSLSGIAMILFSAKLQLLFGFDNEWVFPIVGINLLVFAVFVYFVSNRKLTNQPLVQLITILDGIWVLGSFIIVVFGWFNLTQTGYIIISLVAAWIGFLAYQQRKYQQAK